MKQLTSKQFIILAFITMISQKMFMLPALILSYGGRDSYLSIITFIILDLLILSVILFIVKKQQNTFYNLLDKSLSKIIGRIICVIMLAYLFVKLMILLCEFRVFFNNILSEPLTDWLAIIPLCFLLFIIGTKTLRGIGRLAEILVFFIFGSMLILVLLVVVNIDFSRLMPFLENGLTPIFKSVFYFPMWFGDVSLLIIALGNVEHSVLSQKSTYIDAKTNGKGFSLSTLIVASVGGAMALFFSLALFSAYADLPDLIDFSHNISNMLLYSSSSFIYGRFDVPLFCIWIFAVFIELSLVFYTLTRHICYILPTKNNKLISIITALMAYLTFTFIFKTDYTLLNLSVSKFRFFALFNMIFVPILIAILTIIKHKKERKL